MAKFDLATSKNMKVWIFDLAVALRRANVANTKAITALEKLNREGNIRDIDTSEVMNALILTGQAASILQYVQGIVNTANAENSKLENVKQDPNSARAALYNKIDSFYKLAK